MAKKGTLFGKPVGQVIKRPGALKAKAKAKAKAKGKKLKLKAKGKS